MGGAFSRASSAVLTTNLKHCILYKADHSPASRAVLMAIDAMKLSVNEVDVNIDKGEHKSIKITAMNSLQTLPILQDKNTVICDSHAIAAYLANRYSPCDKIYPRSPKARALVDQALYYNGSKLYPIYRSAAYPILRDNCRFVMPQNVCDIECAYTDLENMLIEHNCFAARWWTLADISLAATISTLNILVPIDKTRYPKLCNWLSQMSEESFYVTGNKEGLSEFSRRIDVEQICDGIKIKYPRTSSKRRAAKSEVEPIRGAQI